MKRTFLQLAADVIDEGIKNKKYDIRDRKRMILNLTIPKWARASGVPDPMLEKFFKFLDIKNYIVATNYHTDDYEMSVCQCVSRLAHLETEIDTDCAAAYVVCSKCKNVGNDNEPLPKKQRKLTDYFQ